MKKDMFGDLDIGDSGKYKNFNDRVVLEERAAALDKKIEEASKKIKTVSWAHEILEFYEHTKSVDADILGKAMNAGLLEQIKRDADYVIAKDNQAQAAARAAAEAKAKAEREARAKAEAEAKIKAEREAKAKAEAEAKAKAEREARAKAEAEAKKAAAEKKVADAAREADERIDALCKVSKADRGAYWCKDVDEAEKFVLSLSPKSRSMCKMLSMLEILKKERTYIEAAESVDEHIMSLYKTDENSRNKNWCKDVFNLKKCVNSDVEQYIKRSFEFSSIINAAEIRNEEIKEEEACKKAEAAKRVAEEERRRKEEEQKKQKALAARRRASLFGKFILALFAVGTIAALVLLAIKVPSSRSYLLGAICAIAYALLFCLLGADNEVTVSLSVAGSILSAIMIPFTCIQTTRGFALLMSIGMAVTSVILYFIKIDSSLNDEEIFAIGVQMHLSVILAMVNVGLALPDSTLRYVVIALGIVVGAASFGLIAAFKADFLYDVYTPFAVVETIIASIGGIVFMFINPGFRIMALALFAASGTFVATACIANDEEDYAFHGLWWLIPLAIDIILLLVK